MPSPSRATANGRETLGAFATEFGEETCFVMACPPKEAVSFQLFVVGRPHCRLFAGSHEAVASLRYSDRSIRSNHSDSSVFIGITRRALQTLCQENCER